MTRTELLELIANGENSVVEFKRATVEPRALAKEIVAFANGFGGRVLLGVEDNGSLSGIERPDVEEWAMTVCRDKIRPPVIPGYERLSGVEPGKDVVVLSIERGWTVHHLWHENHATYYVRVGSQSREADREELARLLQRRGALRCEMQPVPRAFMDALNRPRLVDYFGRVRGQAVPAESDTAEWERLLLNTEMLVRMEDLGRPVCSVGGLLLFGTMPRRFLPQSGADVTVFPGIEKDYDARLRESVRGPMVRLCDPAGYEQAPGIVEQVMRLLQPHLSSERLSGVTRVRDWTYPEAALREALVNALVHRDYLLAGTTIEVSVYADRCEIVSPGSPPNGITPDHMRAGCRVSRNEMLKDVMHDYGYVEHLGMGIPRKILKTCREQLGKEPDLLAGDERFSVIFRK